MIKTTRVTSNRFVNSRIQGEFSKVGFSPWETFSRLCSCKTLILQRAHPPLRPKCLFQAQELTRCFPEKNKSGAHIFAVSFITKPCHPVKEQDRAPWQKGYGFQPESEDWNIIIWGTDWAYRSSVFNGSSSFRGTPLTSLGKSKAVSDHPQFTCHIGSSQQYTHIWINSRFHPEDLRNAEATYGTFTLGNNIAPHMKSDSILEVIENIQIILIIWLTSENPNRFPLQYELSFSPAHTAPVPYWCRGFHCLFCQYRNFQQHKNHFQNPGRGVGWGCRGGGTNTTLHRPPTQEEGGGKLIDKMADFQCFSAKGLSHSASLSEKL